MATNSVFVDAASISGQASKLLDFSQKLDIALLDSIVGCLYSGAGEQQRAAQEVLTAMKEHPDAWARVDTILEFSKNQQTKYFALQILEQVINTRWKVIPRNQCEGIKKYTVGLIIKTSTDGKVMEMEKVYLNKLNIILVQILKREWPKNWESFIPDIVGASKTNESICQNNMTILKLLSEEIFEFSGGQMTQKKTKHLKDTMCSEFAQIFELCQFVMETSQNALLVASTLETLLKFLVWIPFGYIFETKLIPTLIFKFLNVPMFRNVTLKCLTEIASLYDETYDDSYITLYTETLKQIEKILPLCTNIREAYADGQDSEQNFIQNLAIFLCTQLKVHGQLLASQELNQTLMNGYHFLLLISEVEEVEVFKICLEYWNVFTAEQYRDNLLTGTISLGTRKSAETKFPDASKQFYCEVLKKLRYIMITRMAKPKEVLVVENENGEIVREHMKDTDSINLYKNMRETLVYLTHLDYVDTERFMTEKLQNQVNGLDLSWKNLNTLCWAIGSISGAMNEKDEERFLVAVIKDLLTLCEKKSGKDNKAVIASNIMYVVGQHPRFLRAHWKFLKTIVMKLFEFMHETHDGVQDMACDTFIKIASKCRHLFVNKQMCDEEPFIESILINMNSIICELQPQQAHTFYEGVGYMINAQADQDIQEKLIEKYMMLPNHAWKEIIREAAKNEGALKDHEAVKQLACILKTNTSACKALGHPYVIQIRRIYVDMLGVYTVMSENINIAIAVNGVGVTKTPLIKTMKVVRKEIIMLIADWISRSNDRALVLEHYIPIFLETVLLDFKRAQVPSAREPEVLSGLGVIVNKLESHIAGKIPEIFDAVFECTLDMINKDLEEYPEHRTNFFLLLQAVNNHCFPAFLSISPTQFKLVVDSIIWAFKHTMRKVADTGLQILYRLLQNVERLDQNIAQSFYQTYFTDIMKHIFSVATDTSHTAGLTMHSTILTHMFNMVDRGRISVPLGPNPDNVLYVKELVAELLKAAFPHVSDNAIKVTVGEFCKINHISTFKEHLRDFLVQIRENAGEDDSDLYLDEREEALRVAEEEKRKVQLSVPGIINPHEIPEDMQE